MCEGFDTVVNGQQAALISTPEKLVRTVRVDAAVSAVRASPLLRRLVDLNVLDD